VASAGQVTATFSFDTDDSYGYSGMWLEISRGGQVLHDEEVSAEGCEEPSCLPGGLDRDSVVVKDLDADGEPEVVVSLYWGGAHCCFIAVIFAFDGSGYRRAEHNFGNPSFRLVDIDSDGTAEFLTADDRFAYRFTAYAFSILPVRVMAWDGSHLFDETWTYRDRIRADLKRTSKLMRAVTRRGSFEPRGAVAAWAADRYRLGMRDSTLRILRRLATTGRLNGGPPRDPLKFVSTLDRFLLRHGYA
jgi:hypothetical protein